MNILSVTDPIASLLGDWSAQINFCSVLLRIVLSLVMSAIIGCERAGKRHAAGLRTFILASLACTVAMILDIFAKTQLCFISAASVIGVAIISSNSILFSSRNQIKGLTTSVGLWACGILGLAVGAGLYAASLIIFVALLCSLSVFPTIERHLKNRSNHFEVHLELKNKSNLSDFVTVIRRLGLRIDDIESNPAYLNSGLSVYSVSVTIMSKELKEYKTHEQIIEALRSLEFVYHIEEMS
ncbi:MAG: MgtC/SapB family protein [Ruminococcaceae bacterium]|nr:MgtC/SapB family protein [Oscillospiraceae bacterium]